jgi:hypothetical protein
MELQRIVAIQQNDKFDLGVIIRLGATAVYTEGPFLEGTFFVIAHYMFRRTKKVPSNKGPSV